METILAVGIVILIAVAIGAVLLVMRRYIRKKEEEEIVRCETRVREAKRELEEAERRLRDGDEQTKAYEEGARAETIAKLKKIAETPLSAPLDPELVDAFTEGLEELGKPNDRSAFLSMTDSLKLDAIRPLARQALQRIRQDAEMIKRAEEKGKRAEMNQFFDDLLRMLE